MKRNILLLTFSLASFIAFSQVNIPVTRLVSENFNSIGSSATATLPASWKMSSAGTGAASNYTTGTNVTVTTQAANAGTPTTGGRYNWATTAGTDRAIGFMSDAGYADGNAIFADYKNTTGSNITSVTVSFNVERYRINTGTAFVSLFYSTNGTTWTAANSGDISGGVFVPGASSYTFTSPQTVYKKLSIGSLAIANNSDFYLRWVFTAGGTASQGLALDDVVLFAQAATPVVTGSLRDNLQVDNNSNGQADFGDQIRYTTVIRNTGTGDATGVTLTNPTPANTTLNPGSVKTSALAVDDNYTTAFNTVLNGSTVLVNDFGLPAPTVTTFGSVSDPTTTANGTNIAKSDNGGNVIMNTNGTFTYTPPAGFTGFDRFSYIATTGTAPDNAAVVTIAVGTAASTGTADSYNVAGNVSITTPGSGTGNLLANDGGSGLAVATVNGSAASIGNPITTANGGTLTVNSNGSFTYNPAPGYEGADNFTYTTDNGFSSPSAPVTVTLTITGMIWFIDNNYAGALSDGRLGSPFKTLAAFQAVNNGTGNNPAVNDNIFLYSNGIDYTGGITLLNGQKLIGAGASASLATVSGVTIPLYSAALPATAQTPPVIVNAAGNGVTLNSAGGTNTIRGFDLNNCSGNAVNGLTFGTLTVNEVNVNTTGQGLSFSTGAVNGTFPLVTSTGGVNNMAFSSCTGNLAITAGTCSGATNTAFVLTGGAISINTGQNFTQTANFALLSATAGHTGTITSTGTLSAATGTGLQFDNGDGTYIFSGIITLNGGDAGIDILNGSGGTFSFSNSTSNISNPTNELIKVNASTANVTYSGAFTKTNNTANGILVNGETGGTISINGTGTKTITNTTGNAVNLTTNTGTTINFSGNNLLLTTTNGIGFNATGGGTVSIAGTGNTIFSTTGTALNVVNTGIGAGNLNFKSITAGTAASGPAMGINLTSTGATGGLIVTGTGVTAGTGGTIQKCTHGIFASSSSNLSLANMNIINNGLNQTAAGASNTVGGDLITGNNLSAVANITLFSVTNASLTNLTVTGSSQIGINGNAVNGLTIANCTVNSNGNESFEGGVMLQNASGTVNITGTSVRDNRARELHIANGAGTMTLNTSSSQYGHTASGTGTAESQQGILMQLYGTSNTTINASSITVSNNDGIGFTANGFQLNADNGGPIVNGGITGSVFDNNAAHVFINAGGTSTVTFNTMNNPTMTRAVLQGINYTILGGSAAITASLTGTISGNNIGTAVTTGCFTAGGNCHAMDFNTGSNWSGQMHVKVSNNTITNTDVGIFFTLDGSPVGNAVTPQVHAKITGNSITNSSAPANGEALKLNAAVTSTNPKLFVCWDAGGTGLQNIITGNWATGASQASLYLRHRFTGNASIQLPGYGGSSTDDAAVTTYLTGRNAITNGPAGGQVPVFVSHGAGLTPFVGGAPCTTP